MWFEKKKFIAKFVSGVLKPVMALEETAWLPSFSSAHHQYYHTRDMHTRGYRMEMPGQIVQTVLEGKAPP